MNGSSIESWSSQNCASGAQPLDPEVGLRIRDLCLEDDEGAVEVVVGEDGALLAAVRAVLGSEIDAVHDRRREEPFQIVDVEAFLAIAGDREAVQGRLAVRGLVAAVDRVRQDPLDPPSRSCRRSADRGGPESALWPSFVAMAWSTWNREMLLTASMFVSSRTRLGSMTSGGG